MADDEAKLKAVAGEELKLKAFLHAAEKVESESSHMTSEQQIDRLLRPGAQYRNLNPYEVLDVDAEEDDEVIRKKIRTLGFLLHPDKNPNRVADAQKAFQIVQDAKKMMDSPEDMAYVNAVIEEAKESFPSKLEKLRKEASKRGETTVEDLSKEQHKASLRRHTIKLFADKEVERRHREQIEKLQKDREREAEQAEKDAKKAKIEAEKAWEASRDARMSDWLSFDKKRKEKKVKGGFRPPKLKTERREPQS